MKALRVLVLFAAVLSIGATCGAPTKFEVFTIPEPKEEPIIDVVWVVKDDQLYRCAPTEPGRNEKGRVICERALYHSPGGGVYR